MQKKLMELKEEIENSTIIVKSFNSPLSIKGRTTRQKINKIQNYSRIKINEVLIILLTG